MGWGQFFFSVSGLCVAGLGFSGTAFGQTSGLPFSIQRNSNTWMNLQAADAGDFNNDGAPDFYLRGAFAFDLMLSMSRDGAVRALASFPMLAAPVYPASMLPSALAVGHGDVNGDRRDDLVTLTSSGAVMVYGNSGGYATGAASFLPGQTVDFFGPNSTLSPPFLVLATPILKVVDLDADGNLDLVTASGFIDIWTASTRPGSLMVYFNRGNGNFVKASLPIPGNVIDLEVVDLNRDQQPDHLAIVTETSGFGVGAFAYELHHATWSGVPGTLVFSNPAQPLFGRVTALEVADVLGTADPDYLVSTVTYSAQRGLSTLNVFEGNGQGGLNLSAPTQIPLPVNTTGLGDTVLSFKTTDADGDGSTDLLVLRSYTQGVPLGSSQQVQFAPAEVLVAMGPSAVLGNFTPVALGGFILDPIASQSNAALLPLFSTPDALRSIDLDCDPAPDFSVGPLLVPVGNQTQMDLAVFKNTRPLGPADAGYETVGAPSGGVAARPAWIGFDPGRPVLGNTDFGVRASNLPSGALVSFVWSPFGMPNLYSTEGVDVHLIPVVYSNLITAQGTGPTGGTARCPLPIPNDPALVGDGGFFQCGTFDPSTGRFGGTEAVHVHVGR